jgi:hypothetical protein
MSNKSNKNQYRETAMKQKPTSKSKTEKIEIGKQKRTIEGKKWMKKFFFG